MCIVLSCECVSVCVCTKVELTRAGDFMRIVEEGWQVEIFVCCRLPAGSRMVGQMPSTISQDLLSASAGGATNGDDNQNSTSSTTNGGGGMSGAPESLGKSPSVAMVTTNSPTALVTSPLMNFYDAAPGNSTSGGNTYITHPQPGSLPPRAGSKSGGGGNSATSRHFWRCSWQYWIILICILAFLLAVSFAVFFSGLCLVLDT